MPSRSKVFQDDDKAFLAWMRANPKGFVLNARRKASHPVCVMHRSGCTHILGVRNSDTGALTEGPVMKVCATNVEALLHYVHTERTGRLALVKRCRSCDPIRSDIRVEPQAEERPQMVAHDRHTVMVPMNVYERNPEAIAVCLAHHGAICRVCAVDFRRRYGAIGDGFMQVHHLRQVGPADTGYVLDPVNDLVPVCPNCHAMLHRGREKPRSVEELRRIMELARKFAYGPNGWVERMEQSG